MTDSTTIKITTRENGHIADSKKFTSLKKAFKKRLRKIDHFIDLNVDAVTTEAIHELRVEIKKIRSLSYLAKSTRKGSGIKKYIAPFKKLFKKAGKLRSIQVEFNLVHSYFTPDADANYLHQLHELKQERWTAFRKFINGRIRDDIRRNGKKIIPILKKVSGKDILRYFQTEEKKMGQLVDKNIYREQELHFARKNLKRLSLNAKSITSSNIDDRWNKLLDLLGEWHDHQLAYDQLVKAIYSGSFSEAETEKLQPIKSKLQQDKGALFEQIVATYSDSSAKGHAGSN